MEPRMYQISNKVMQVDDYQYSHNIIQITKKGACFSLINRVLKAARSFIRLERQLIASMKK